MLPTPGDGDAVFAGTERVILKGVHIVLTGDRLHAHLATLWNVTRIISSV